MVKILGSKNSDEELVIASVEGDVFSRVPFEVREQMQYLFSRLEVHNGGVPFSLGITSSMSGEGVSFISQALAAVLSEDLGHRTCLVRTNWWSEGDALDTTNLGLAGVLRGTATIDDVLLQTRFPRLSIMPSGALPAFQRALFAKTDAVANVLDQLRGQFDHVLLDLPANSTTPASLILGAAADATLLVVRQRTTQIDQVEHATDDLRNANLLGIVINDNQVSLPSVFQRRLLDA
jgi:Mrp family chromosome partitioning ATPase